MARKKQAVAGKEPKGLFINIDGELFDLTAGMIEAVTNPPPGFASKHKFAESDIVAKIGSINWFVNCGQPFALDLTMEAKQVRTWNQALKSCKSPAWDNAVLEAQNQLTLWLHLHQREKYQRWNETVDDHKKKVVNPLTEEKIVPFQIQNSLDIVFVHSVQWNILGALMENSYMKCGHSAFFFLELLMVFEVGHFPCGWEGDWPQGKLVVY